MAVPDHSFPERDPDKQGPSDEEFPEIVLPAFKHLRLFVPQQVKKQKGVPIEQTIIAQAIAGPVEHVLQVEIGVAHPELAGYVAHVIARFSRQEALTKKGEFLLELEAAHENLIDEGRFDRTVREERRLLGDKALFIVGMYREQMEGSFHNLRSGTQICNQVGVTSYHIASEYDESVRSYPVNSELLELVSDAFDHLARGITRLREEFNP